MKLRLYRDSIRLRLSPRDVSTLVDVGEVRASIPFAPGIEFAYALRLKDDVDEPTATFAESTLVVDVPAFRGRAWAEGDAVGMRHEQPAGPGRSLSIQIEKDFECLDEPAAEGETFYPNPKKAC